MTICFCCKLQKEEMQKEHFCGNCYFDRVLYDGIVDGFEIMVYLENNEPKCYIKEPSELSQWRKVEKLLRFLEQFYTPLSSEVQCICGNKVMLKHSILVRANDSNIALCDMDCYEIWKEIIL